jgi:hypothetical protein
MLNFCLSIGSILIWDSNLSRLNKDGPQRMCKDQLEGTFHSHFCIEIEWLKQFTELEVCRLDTQCHTFPNWVTNISTNVQKLEPHLNPKCGKMRFQSTTLSQIVFGQFLSQ